MMIAFTFIFHHFFLCCGQGHIKRQQCCCHSCTDLSCVFTVPETEHVGGIPDVASVVINYDLR